VTTRGSVPDGEDLRRQFRAGLTWPGSRFVRSENRTAAHRNEGRRALRLCKTPSGVVNSVTLTCQDLFFRSAPHALNFLSAGSCRVRATPALVDADSLRRRVIGWPHEKQDGDVGRWDIQLVSVVLQVVPRSAIGYGINTALNHIRETFAGTSYAFATRSYE